MSLPHEVREINDYEVFYGQDVKNIRQNLEKTSSVFKKNENVSKTFESGNNLYKDGICKQDKARKELFSIK